MKQTAKLPAKPRAPKKRGRGHPAEVATPERREQVRAMAGYGITREHIAIVMQIDKKTLLKHYHQELEAGLAIAAVSIGQKLYDLATKKVGANVTAIIWWEKTRLGLTERSAIEHTGKNGGPIEHEHDLSPLAALSDEELAARLERRSAGGGAGAPAQGSHKGGRRA